MAIGVPDWLRLWIPVAFARAVPRNPEYIFPLLEIGRINY